MSETKSVVLTDKLKITLGVGAFCSLVGFLIWFGIMIGEEKAERKTLGVTVVEKLGNIETSLKEHTKQLQDLIIRITLVERDANPKKPG